MHDAFFGIKRLLRIFVGEAFVGVDNRLAKPNVLNIRFFVERENGGDSEPVFVRLQRAEVGGENFGEHWNGAVDEIDTRRALHRLRI